MRGMHLALALLLSLACRNKDIDPDSGLFDNDGDGWTVGDGDCNDEDPEVHPAAEEICDGVDNDCDGDTDGGLTLSAWLDEDNDGYGAQASVEICELTEGYADNDEDCDDSDPAVNPQADEVCNGIDDNCDGETDESGDEPWYEDSDGDGYGNPNVSADTCDPDSAWVQDDSDCDDEDPEIHPGVEDICNLQDDDCDGKIDEDSEFTWYMDNDGDGWGSDVTVDECSQPSGTSDQTGDCDDGDAEIHPEAVEICDGEDNDCNGDTDTDAVDAQVWYLDSDGDGFGDQDNSTTSCEAPSDYVAEGGDCADDDESINPGAEEWCDGIDTDCNGTLDDDYASDATTWYMDSDGDGYGDPNTTTTACDQPSDATTDDTDCDDTDEDINPGAEEVCTDGVDDDCNGTADDGCPVEHCGTISSDETWASSDPHLVTCNVYVQGSGKPTLTIEDGTTVTFDSGTNLYVGWGSYGQIVVQGTSTDGVVFTSDDSNPAEGDWDGVAIGYYDQDSTLAGLTLEYAGGNGIAGLYVYYAEAEITDSTIQYNENYGIYVTGAEPLIQDSSINDNTETGVYVASAGGLDTGGSNPTFSGNTLTGNGDHPIALPANYLNELDSSSSFTGNTEDSIMVLADTVTDDATWRLLGVPYLFDGDVHVQGSGQPEIVVEDGVEAYFENNVDLFVAWSSYGSIDIQGSSTGVLFTSSESSPSQGDWAGLTIGYYDEGSAIEGLEIAYAGDNGYGCLRLYYTELDVTDSSFHDCENHGVYVGGSSEVLFTGSTFSDNADNGLYIEDAASLDDGGSGATFTDNTLSGNGDFPLTLPANELSMLDSSSSFTGNNDDHVEILGDTVFEDGTWQALDVPVLVSGDVYIQGAAKPEIEIEDGASFAFDGNAGLLVGWSHYGSLTLSGSSTGITFTSYDSSPAAGDWDGITIGYYSEGTQELTGFTVEYGGDNGYGGLWGYYSDLEISDCTLADNDSDGVFLTSSNLEMSDCTLADNDDNGLYLDVNSSLENGNGFTNNTLTGNGDYPVVLPANHIGGLSGSSSYTGNGTDQIYVQTDYVYQDATWELLDVDYAISGDVYIQGSGQPHVEIEGGITFYMDGALYVAWSNYGSFEIDGSSSGVTFTSAESSPAAGDWDGISLGYYCNDNKVALDGVTVEYGGDNGYGNIRWYYCEGSIDNAAITDSSSYGMYRQAASPTIGTVSYSNNASGDLY